MRKSIIAINKAALPVVLTACALGLHTAHGQTIASPAKSLKVAFINPFAADTQGNRQTQSTGAQSNSQTTSAPGTLPRSTSPMPTLTPREKLCYGLRQAFYTPGSYIGPIFGAGFRQFNEVDVPAKSGADKFADYLADYARGFGTASTTEIFAAGIYPALFKQNPKYLKLKDLSGGRASRHSRLWYAIGNAVITTGDNGRRQLNYSRLGGNLTGAALANVWERNTPRERDGFGIVTAINRRRGAGPTFRRFGISVGFDALTNVFEEFFGLGR